MGRKISLILALLCSSVISHNACAETPPSSKPFQFYGGVSLGVNSLSGRQNQNVYYPAGGATSNISFINNVSASNKDGAYSLFGGGTWSLPNLPVFIGPEIYIGRASNNIQSQLTFVLDTFNGTGRSMQTNIRQSNFFGGSLQIGAHLPWKTRGYILLGFDSSQFRYDTYYIPRSHAVLAGMPDIPPSYFTTTKRLNGFVWGLGLEKTINCFRVGGDVRFIQYSTLRVSYITDSADAANSPETINNSFKPKNIRFSLRFSYLF